MITSLNIFVRSLNPNPYLNSIVYSIKHLGVERVSLVGIRGKSSGLLQLLNLERDILELLANLSMGRYIYRSIKDENINVVDLSNYYDTYQLDSLKSYYSDCQKVLSSNIIENAQLIEYKTLQGRIALMQKTEKPIFDVTAATNDIVSDLVAISISERISSLYTFSTRDQPKSGLEGWRHLIHQLESEHRDAEPSYQYQNLLDSDVYKDSLYRIFGTSERAEGNTKALPSISREDIDDQLELLRAHRATLQKYLQQQAKTGSIYSLPYMEHGIEDARRSISRIKSALRGWGEEISDHPNDGDF